MIKKTVGVNSNVNVTVLQPMKIEHIVREAVCVKGELYIFGRSGNEGCFSMSLDKYSPAS